MTEETKSVGVKPTSETTADVAVEHAHVQSGDEETVLKESSDFCSRNNKVIVNSMVKETNKGAVTTVTRVVSKTPKAAKARPASEFKPDYVNDDQKKGFLANCTKEVEHEISNMVKNRDLYGAVGVSDNVIINLREAVKNGIHIYGMEVNREHGKDETQTGMSLFSDGAQMWLNVITLKVAKLYGFGFKKLANDKDDKHSPQDEDLVLLDGHGRMNFLLQYDVNDWPAVYAHFPSKDALGYYNLSKVMETINVNIKVWATSNYVQKRILQEGDKTHEGWMRINSLVQRGYNYQAACQLTTLGKDRVTKKEVNSGNANSIFTDFTDAFKVSEALIGRFGEGEDNVVKTKVFTGDVSNLWQRLRKQSGNNQATDTMVGFIKGLPDDKVTEIKRAKKTDDGVSKDVNRTKILNAQFADFAARNNIQLGD